MSITLDSPWTLLTIMVYFSSLSESSPGWVASSGSLMWWFIHVAFILLVGDSFNNRTLTCPPDLITAIKETHAKNENILSVSVTNNGNWFLSTDSVKSKHIFTTPHLPFVWRLILPCRHHKDQVRNGAWRHCMDHIYSCVLQFCHVTTMKIGCKMGLGDIVWITFTPNGQGFIGVVCQNSVAHCVFE